jgi:hypothetical protein
MKLSDEKVIEFLARSPIRSFQSMLDSLRYLEGFSIEAESEFELFDWGLGDNPTERIEIMIPTNRGIPANALFAFMQHAQSFNVVSRRSRMIRGMANSPERLRLFYGLTPSGGYIVKILEVLTDVSTLSKAVGAGAEGAAL